MKAVRYFSKLGNTKTIAEAIAEGAGVQAVSITDAPTHRYPRRQHGYAEPRQKAGLCPICTENRDDEE